MDEARLCLVQESLLNAMLEHQIKGLVLVAPEGVNGTVAGSDAAILEFKRQITSLFPGIEIGFKDSICHEMPFKWTNVDRREEIVGLKKPELVPGEFENNHLSPAEWHEKLTSGEQIQLIDTRNVFETKIGKFKGAIDPGLTKFSEWGDYLDSAPLEKDKPTLIYCTGGIRCEKAILEMQQRGFEKVYQLRDGILGYLAEYPEAEYEGECFVFDERVAVDQHLRPTERFGICPGCGLTSEVRIECDWCGRQYFTCEGCQESRARACSKTCLDRLSRHGKAESSKNLRITANATNLRRRQ